MGDFIPFAWATPHGLRQRALRRMVSPKKTVTQSILWSHFYKTNVSMGSVRVRFGVGLGSVWGLFGVGSGSVRGRFGFGLGSVCSWFGLGLRSVWGRRSAKFQKFTMFGVSKGRNPTHLVT